MHKGFSCIARSMPFFAVILNEAKPFAVILSEAKPSEGSGIAHVL
jgi:hypothetical protein